jgi:hypothetical protein
MDLQPLATGIHVLGGLAILFFGRRLFWLFVGVVGFLVSFQAAPLLLPAQPPWVVLVAALAVGAVGALLAAFLQYAAAAVAGFLLGSLTALPMGALVGRGAAAAVGLVAGVAGAFVMVLVFDWSLIGLSALAGAVAVLQPFALSPVARALGVLAVALVGAAVQAAALAPAEEARRT